MPQHYDELDADDTEMVSEYDGETELRYGVAVDEDEIEELYGKELEDAEAFIPEDSYDDDRVSDTTVEAVEDALYDVADEVGDALEEGTAGTYTDTLETDDGIEVSYEVDVDEAHEYADIAVTFADLPEGLHGFTDTSTDFVVINKNLYEFERETTIEHEKEHQRNPHMPEWQVRHRVGGTDPEYSASVRRNPRDIGDGGVSQYGCC